MGALENVDWESYDFIDLGCSTGGSIEHCMSRFGAKRGLGIDLDPDKVENTKRTGLDAVVADARELNLDGQVSFISMLDFCEHLPEVETVQEIITAAAASARDFLYIKHPSFEGQEYAEGEGVRQYWWGWHGHTAHVRVADYCTIFDLLGLSAYMIRYIGRVDDSTHPSIIPTTTPMDQSESDAQAITDVPEVSFSPPLWRRQDIFVALRPFETDEWHALTRPTAQDLKLMRATGQLPGDQTIAEHLRPKRKTVSLSR
ncbi:MAG: class I SAM-dependent methyltransferase [Solirubrobacterales bacterium]